MASLAINPDRASQINFLFESGRTDTHVSQVKALLQSSQSEEETNKLEKLLTLVRGRYNEIFED